MDLFPEFSTTALFHFKLTDIYTTCFKLIKVTPCYFMALRDHKMDI